MEKSVSFYGQNHGLQVGVNNAPIHAAFNLPPGKTINIQVHRVWRQI